MIGGVAIEGLGQDCGDAAGASVGAVEVPGNVLAVVGVLTACAGVPDVVPVPKGKGNFEKIGSEPNPNGPAAVPGAEALGAALAV